MKVIRGEIKEGTIPELIVEIIREKFTGILHTEKEKVKKEFFFINGNIVSSRSNLLSETLGRVALSIGALKPEVYEKALDLMKSGGMKFGEAVAKLGWKLDIDRLLVMQLQQRFFDVLNWRSGTYFLLPKSLEVEKIYPFIRNLDTLKLLAEGIMSRIDGTIIEHKKMELLNAFYKEGNPLDRVKLLPEVKEVLKDSASGWEIVKAIKKPEPQNIQMLYFYLITGALKKVEPPSKRIEKTTVNVPQEERELYEKLLQKYNEMKSKNYFEILNVERGATDAEIREAYYKLAMEYHPDRYFMRSEHVRDLVDRIFTLVNDAFSTLSDKERREEYELSLDGKMLSPEESSKILEAEIQFKKAEILDRSGKLKEAIDLYRWALKLNPHEPEYRAKLGWALYRLGKKTGKAETIEEGKLLIMKSYEENPENPEITYTVASYYRAEGNRGKTIEFLEKTLSLDPSHESAKRELKFLKSNG